MPRDLFAETARATEIKPDLSKPSPTALAYALRNLETVLPGHVWDFTAPHYTTPCGSAGCAFGVAKELWGGDYP